MRQRKMGQRFLFPLQVEVDGKGLIPDAIVILPPPIRTTDAKGASQSTQNVFRFDEGTAKAGEVQMASEAKTVEIVAQQLRGLITSEKEPTWLRVFALNWLTGTRLEQSTDILIKLAGGEGVPGILRYAAIGNIESGKVKDAGPTQVKVLQRKPIEARITMWTIDALAAIGGNFAAAIRPFLNDTNSGVVSAAVRAVGRMKDAESVWILLTKLTDMKIKEASSFAELMASLRSQFDANSLGEAIATIGTSDAISGLWTLMQNQKGESGTRVAALKGLSKSGKIRTGDAPTLVSLLTDEAVAANVRIEVISALKNIGSPEALSAIRSATNSKNKDVQQKAEQALK